MPRQVLYEALVDPGWDGGGDGLAALPRISGTHSSSVAASQRANSRGWLKPGRLGAQTLAAARIHHGLLPSRSRSGFSGEAGLGLKALACHAQTFTWPRPWAYEVAGAEKRVPPGRAAVRCGAVRGMAPCRSEENQAWGSPVAGEARPSVAVAAAAPPTGNRAAAAATTAATRLAQWGRREAGGPQGLAVGRAHAREEQGPTAVPAQWLRGPAPGSRGCAANSVQYPKDGRAGFLAGATCPSLGQARPRVAAARPCRRGCHPGRPEPSRAPWCLAHTGSQAPQREVGPRRRGVGAHFVSACIMCLSEGRFPLGWTDRRAGPSHNCPWLTSHPRDCGSGCLQLTLPSPPAGPQTACRACSKLPSFPTPSIQSSLVSEGAQVSFQASPCFPLRLCQAGSGTSGWALADQVSHHQEAFPTYLWGCCACISFVLRALPLPGRKKVRKGKCRLLCGTASTSKCRK